MITQQTKDGCDVCFTQQGSNTFIFRTAAVNRRHSTDGTVSSEPRSGRCPVDSDNRFHPYRRQYSDSAVTAAGCLQHSSPFSCLQEVCGPDTLTHSSSSEVLTSWDQYNGSIQVSRLMVPSFYPHLSIPGLCIKKQQLDISRVVYQVLKIDYYTIDFRLQAGLEKKHTYKLSCTIV